ncbi:hypothetical protein DB771_09490 [Burkholderia sp. AU29985]|nr:hypothetical protein EGY28_11870 [Burkholderia dolosa]PRE54428.1 hypothetical protein C6P87_06275 [Burkholderia sp. AU12872]PUA77126.1 hypothetical protein DB771_09490 [Burkholderia sp. AU29985]
MLSRGKMRADYTQTKWPGRRPAPPLHAAGAPRTAAARAAQRSCGAEMQRAARKAGPFRAVENATDARQRDRHRAGARAVRTAAFFLRPAGASGILEGA